MTPQGRTHGTDRVANAVLTLSELSATQELWQPCASSRRSVLRSQFRQCRSSESPQTNGARASGFAQDAV